MTEDEPAAPPRRAGAWQITRRTIQAWLDHDAIRWSAAIAYYSVVSLAPLVVLVATLVSTVMEGEAARAWVREQVAALGGPQEADVTRTVLEEMPVLDLGSLGAILTMLLFAFGAVMVFSVFLRSVLRSVGPVFQVLDAILPYVAVAEVLSSVLMLSLAVSAIFWVLPDVKIRWRDVWVGALVTTLLLVFGKSLLSGFLGAEFTQVWAEERGHTIEPTENAVRIRMVEGERQRLDGTGGRE